MARALFLLLVAPLMALGTADAQTGGIQVAPVMVALSAERTIASLRVRNERERPVAFEVDVYEWTQVDGEDVLTPSRDLLIAPGVFEIGARGEQVVRLGVTAAGGQNERAFRILMRELPAPRREGAVLGFALELSLPVFIAPLSAHSELSPSIETRSWGPTLVLDNSGSVHVQIARVEETTSGALRAPRYILAGGRAEIPLAPEARTVRLVTLDSSGESVERLVHVPRADRSSSQH